MNCHACGAPLAGTARFCHKCGARVGGTHTSGWRAGLPWVVAGGNAAAALAQADTIRRAVPMHLFGFMLRARGLELERDTAGARRAYRDFLRHEAVERTRQRPEYGEHAEALDAFHEQATAATAAKATRGG